MPLPVPDRGYLLPEIIDPGEYVCLKLYIPNADEYIRAFSGHLELLATWKEWQKDGTNRASQAAQVWKDAIDYTHNNGWIGACMSQECCDAIVNAINNISINVSGGGGCCSVDKTWKLPENWETGLPTEPYIPDPTPTVETQSELCDQAHQTHGRMRALIDDFAEMTKETSPYDTLLDYLIAGTIFLFPVASVMFAALTYAAGALYEFLERDTLAFWDAMKDDFVCSMLFYDNADGFYNWLVDYITANAPNYQVRIWLLTLIQMPDWNNIYDGVFDIDPEYQDSVCDCVFVSTWVEDEPESILGESTDYALQGAPGNGFDLNGTLTPGTGTDTRLVLEIPDLEPTQLQRATFDITVELSNEAVQTAWGAAGAKTVVQTGSFVASVIIHDGTHDTTGYDIAIVKTPTSNRSSISFGIFTFPAPSFTVDARLENFDYLAQ